MALKLTEAATKEIKKTMVIEKLSDKTVLRVGVEGGGCSGFSYSLSFDEEYDDKDIVCEIDGVRVVMDKKSALYLEGMEIDYHNGIDKRGFVFNNPNATKTCGCGSSFQV